MDPAEHEQLDSVRIGTEGAAEMDRHRRAIFIPRQEITRLELAYGSGAERPLVLIILGLLFAAVAVAIAIAAVVALGREEVFFPTKLVSGVAFVVPAWWLLDLSLRRRWFVRVHARKRTTKLVFQRVRDEQAIVAFLETVRRRFGYHVTR